MPDTSKEYVYVPDVVAARGGASPTTFPVYAAYSIDKKTEPTTWVQVTWLAGAATPTARIMVGPGGDLVIPEGKWILWLAVNTGTEYPRRPVDTITIT